MVSISSTEFEKSCKIPWNEHIKKNKEKKKSSLKNYFQMVTLPEQMHLIPQLQ